MISIRCAALDLFRAENLVADSSTILVNIKLAGRDADTPNHIAFQASFDQFLDQRLLQVDVPVTRQILHFLVHKVVVENIVDTIVQWAGRWRQVQIDINTQALGPANLMRIDADIHIHDEIANEYTPELAVGLYPP